MNFLFSVFQWLIAPFKKAIEYTTMPVVKRVHYTVGALARLALLASLVVAMPVVLVVLSAIWMTFEVLVVYTRIGQIISDGVALFILGVLVSISRAREMKAKADAEEPVVTA